MGHYKKYRKCINEVLCDAFKGKKIRLSFFSSFIVLIMGILSNVSIPLLLKKIVESFSMQNGITVTLILLSYAFVWMISQASIYVRTLLTYRIEQRITSILGIKVLSHLYSLSHSYFLSQKTGALSNILRKAQQSVPQIIIALFFHALPTIIEFLFVVFMIYFLYPFIYSLLLIGTLVTFFIYTSMSMNGTLRDREKVNEVDKSVDGVLSDWLSNYEAIKVFGGQKLAIKICEMELKKREDSEVKFMMKYSFSRLGQSLILGIGLASLTYCVGQGVLEGSLTVGDFVLFNGYMLQFIVPISILGHISQDIKKNLVDMKGVIDVLLTPSEIVEVPNPIHLSKVIPSITFENVSFKYKDRLILKDISFKIETGQTAVIIGPTGSGKSTIAKLLLRLFDPIEGNIFINDINLKEISLNSLSETIGWVPQETYLLNDTIKNNLILVHPKATSEEIEEALKNSHLLEFINKLPEGLNTTVGNRGLKLSGGEKQRLSIARIFLKKPRICIFDESTSSLDKDTELVIEENIEKFLPDITKVIITHRPFFKHKVDKIISIKDMIK